MSRTYVYSLFVVWLLLLVALDSNADFVKQGVVSQDQSGQITFGVVDSSRQLRSGPVFGNLGSGNATAGFDVQITFPPALPATLGGAVCVTPTAAESGAFAAAEATWESTITGYQDTVQSNVLTIIACITPIDGVGNILGSAGPLTGKFDAGGASFPPNFIYTDLGLMQFDSADTGALTTTELNDIILHEMGHVLGVGTMWSSSALGAQFAGRQEVYTSGSGAYTGTAALAAWQSEFNKPAATSVPIELGGGPGTADGHWNEVDNGAALTGDVSNTTGTDFAFELMTGWYNPGPTFMSSVTSQSLVDIGYNVVAVPEPTSFLCLGFLFTVVSGCRWVRLTQRS